MQISISMLSAVLWIRIRSDPEGFPGSRFGIIVPDPAKTERAGTPKKSLLEPDPE